ncbi:MAG: response regulator transcription factor [Armatimonadetes bacterium]|nr:response regulator transcription factor [Armatimonadota bacterium]
MAETILVVDDEEAIVEFLEMNLKKEQFEVLKAYSGQEAIDSFKARGPDLILLDVGLPDFDGFEVCTRIRSQSEVPIIMVTARGDDEDKIVGLGIGSDDYVVKPFNPKELVARIKRMLERSRKAREKSTTNKVAFKEIDIDVIKRRVTVNGRIVNVTPKEYDLLVFLVSNQDRVFSREELLREVWGSDAYDTRSVDVHIKYIREKLGEPASAYVQTAWGKGYKFSDAKKS